MAFSDDYVSITKAASSLGVAAGTIKRWYTWWENPNFEKPTPEELCLPPYYYTDKRKTRYFKTEDVEKLRQFRNKINGSYRGIMSDFNAVYCWGKNGKVIANSKGISYEEIRKKLYD